MVGLWAQPMHRLNTFNLLLRECAGNFQSFHHDSVMKLVHFALERYGFRSRCFDRKYQCGHLTRRRYLTRMTDFRDQYLITFCMITRIQPHLHCTNSLVLKLEFHDFLYLLQLFWNFTTKLSGNKTLKLGRSARYQGKNSVLTVVMTLSWL